MIWFIETCFGSISSLRSFGLTQKNQKVKTQQSSSRTRPDAGPLLCRPPHLSDASFVVKKENHMRNSQTKINI